MNTASKTVWSRLERAAYYRALADMLSLSEGSVAEQVRVLSEMPCGDMIMPSETAQIDEQVAAWVAAGEKPHLSELLRDLFGVGFCYKELPVIPACMAFYVRDADGGRERLRELYEQWDYQERRTFAPQCEGTGYVSRQLAFVSHCLEKSNGEPFDIESTAKVLRENLFDWAPLFARALVVSRAHPSVVFVGVKLECLLAHEHEFSIPMLAD